MIRLKTFLKRSNFLTLAYGFVIGIICLISPKLACVIRYRISTGEKLSLKTPIGFNEKLMWLNLYDRNPLKTKCSDKLLVRNYVREKGCEEILNELLYVYDGVENIDWKYLPNKFALKCTFGAGANVICDNKKSLDISKAETILKKGLRPRLLNTTCEIHYSTSTNKIICEKYIETNDGVLPNDYKVYCFNGEPSTV